MLLLTRAFTALGFVIGVLLFTTPAYAEAESKPQRVAITRLLFDGKLPEGLEALFARRLSEGLAAARFQVLTHLDVENQLKTTNPNLSLCNDPVCFPKLAAQLAADYLITAQVTENNKTYTIAMNIINGTSGRPIASNRERCETCGVEEAGEKMGLAASALCERLTTLSRTPARFIIRTRPPGAVVTLDNKLVGSTPLDVNVASGVHNMRLSRTGFDTLERVFTAVNGLDETLELDLVASHASFPYRTAGWASIAGGVVLMAAGIVTMTFNGDAIACKPEEKDSEGDCPYVRNTRWWAASLMGAGLAAGSIGGVFLYLAPRHGATLAVVSYQKPF